MTAGGASQSHHGHPALRPSEQYRLFVQKDQHKFSCAHMTIFDDGSKERMHGHNFHLELAVIAPFGAGALIDFAAIKRVLASICDSLNEHFLLPGSHPSVEIQRRDGDEIEFTACGRRYVMPSEDVLVLPVENVIVERLAEFLAERLHGELRPQLDAGEATQLEVTVREAHGQGATVSRRLQD